MANINKILPKMLYTYRKDLLYFLRGYDTVREKADYLQSVTRETFKHTWENIDDPMVMDLCKLLFDSINWETIVEGCENEAKYDGKKPKQYLVPGEILK